MKEDFEGTLEKIQTSISTLYAGNHGSIEFCSALLSRVKTFGEWLFDRVGRFYKKAQMNAAGAGPTPLKELNAGFWKVTTTLIKRLFKKTHGKRAVAALAHYFQDKGLRNGYFLHTAL